jgi:nucleosome binding factor SPN SPT16 subunit
MKTITDDPVGFIENGGWTFLDPDSDGEGAADDETEDEEDEVYEPTDSEPEGIFLQIYFIILLKIFI